MKKFWFHSDFSIAFKFSDFAHMQDLLGQRNLIFVNPDENLVWRDNHGQDLTIASKGGNQVMVVVCDQVNVVAIPHPFGRLPRVDIYDLNGVKCFAHTTVTPTQTTVRFGSVENPILFSGYVLVS